jgi:hypothetical protein
MPGRPEHVRRIAHTARHIGGELAALLAIVLFAVVDILPRLVPDLRRLIARRDFIATHGVIQSWLDGHFELIEAAVPWLRPVGRRVADSCLTKWQREPLSLVRDPARVVCTRTIWAAYGCDGDLESRLIKLSSTLAAIGWGYLEDDNRTVRHGRLGPSAWPKRSLSWRPAAGLPLAARLPSLAGQPDYLWESADMDVSWADQTDPGNIVTPRSPGNTDPGRASLLYQPVEFGGDEVDVLVAEALLRDENTIMIELRADYYKNANVNAKPDRLPKRFRLARGYLP